MTYEPEANEAMRKPNTLGASASDASEHEGASKPNARIDRVEKGFGCRMDTKRKILEALGLRLADRVRVFGEEE
ncbi:MAG: hypothetical protein JRF54_03390 [Deltaproteobacteria bacterium]|nr:hypothetical protein [Deltaproteobacteria bacterium]